MLLQLVKVFSRADIEIGPFVCGNKTEAGQKSYGKVNLKSLNI